MWMLKLEILPKTLNALVILLGGLNLSEFHCSGANMCY